jgi:DNA-binding NarL/FixJ family response regulator
MTLTMTDTIRVVLADDHTLVRAGIRSLLESFEGIEVVGEAGSGVAALQLVDVYRPAVVLLDIGMPGMGGLEVLGHLSRMRAPVHPLMLSMHRDAEYVVEALRAGAVGYLLKDSAVSELEVAVRTTARGERYLSPAIAESMAEDFIVRRTSTTADAFAQLTPRQREILQLVALGLTSKEIAQKLGVSYRTVEVHRTHLMRRLNVHDVASLVRLAISVGMIRPNE